MKFAKKLAVVLLMLALLVSSSAIFASAEFTEDNIEDVLEYYCTNVYVREDLNTLDAEGVHEALLYSSHEMVKDPKDEENSVWHIVPGDMRNANLVMNLGEQPVDKLVLSTKLMLGEPAADEDESTIEKAPKLNFNIRLHKENGLYDASSFFSFDCQSGKIIYYSYSEESGRLDTANVLEQAPVYGVWYELDFIFNFEKGSYGFTLKNGDNEISINDVSVGPFVATSELRMLLTESRKAQLWLDTIDLYEGSFLRDTTDAGKSATTVDYLKKLDALSKTDISLETKLRIAEVYRVLLIEKSFTPDTEIADYDEVVSLIDSDFAYINAAYKDAILYYSSQIDKTASYGERMEYLPFLDAQSARLPLDEAEFVLLPGLDADAFALVSASREDIEAERTDLEDIKTGSDAYIVKSATYDADNKDYAYMTEFLAGLSAIENVDITYPGVVDTKAAVEDKLDAKIKSIVDVVTKFITATDAMQVIISAVPEHGVCGDSFENLYYGLFLDKKDGDATVKGAQSLYNGGVLHEGLDNATYPGLSEKITLYLAEEDYINSRVLASETFITYVRLASSATQYNIILEKLQLAAKCIDDDLTEFTVEDKYEGVAEAKAQYAALVKKLADLEAAAKLYVAEAAKVEAAMNSGYNALKAALSKALELKKTGDVAGMTGVKEANIILANAEAVIESFEGFSKQLIDSVNALDAENLTLSQRRALINSASTAKAKSTDEIDGVADAKTKLDAQITKYNSDIAAANAAFESAMVTAVSVSVSVAPNDAAGKAQVAFVALFKKEG